VVSPVIAERDLQALLTKAPALSDFDARRLTQALQAEVLERCALDGVFWLKFVQTRDEADPENIVKPFPVHQAYIRELWGLLVAEQKIVIAKSRQMMVSWLVAAYAVWRARFKPHQAIYWQSQQREDSDKMVCLPDGPIEGRCQFIESHLPQWMRQSVKPIEGVLAWPNGSFVQALAGGSNKIRGKTATIVIEDEYAMQEEQAGVFEAVAPLIQKGAQAIFISTPNGTSNMFATLWHGRPVGVEADVA
jgi:hypothetical protein